MDLLSPRQSAILHSLEQQARDDYRRLSPEDQNAIDYLSKIKYIDVFDYYEDYDPEKNDMGYFPSIWGISESGRAYLENERVALAHEQKYEEELKHLRQIADQAQKDAPSADIDARRSRCIAWISVLIALGTLALEAVQFFFI